ncbi:hypothetical protein O181_095808 [Austropuccinia psidii MF-1]|uniref:Uncharacterized protein n=1 Tax=Austropuccinia psidii MF-1 TaxID=1389203 RepID=A0A9Q3J5U2_9BASI|nr:hypothetical protein [Austropuccinia psidii MF-1]
MTCAIKICLFSFIVIFWRTGYVYCGIFDLFKQGSGLFGKTKDGLEAGHTSEGLNAGKGLKPNEPLFHDVGGSPYHKLPDFESGGKRPLLPKMQKPSRLANVRGRLNLLMPSSREMKKLVATVNNIFEQLLQKLYERFQIVLMGRRYLKNIAEFTKKFEKSPVEGQVTLLKTTFEDLTNPNIERSVNEWQKWIDNFEKITQIKLEFSSGPLSVEMEIQMGLCNLIARAQDAVKGSSRIMTLQRVELLQRGLFHRLFANLNTWEKITELKKIKWGEEFLNLEPNLLATAEDAKAMEHQLMSDEYVGRAFSKLKALSGKSDDFEFQNALNRLIGLAVKNTEIKLPPPMKLEQIISTAGSPQNIPQVKLVSPLQKTAATTGLVYAHQSILSKYGLALTETQKRAVDDAIRTIVKQEDGRFTLNYPNLEKLSTEVKNTEPLVQH